MMTRTRDKLWKPREFLNFVAHTISLESEPATFKQALNSLKWRTTMTEKLNVLAKNNTLTLMASAASNQSKNYWLQMSL
jgi:hypothetical protein